MERNAEGNKETGKRGHRQDLRMLEETMESGCLASLSIGRGPHFL